MTCSAQRDAAIQTCLLFLKFLTTLTIKGTTIDTGKYNHRKATATTSRVRKVSPRAVDAARRTSKNVPFAMATPEKMEYIGGRPRNLSFSCM